jgi:hypothetical protein
MQSPKARWGTPHRSQQPPPTPPYSGVSTSAPGGARRPTHTRTLLPSWSCQSPFVPRTDSKGPRLADAAVRLHRWALARRLESLPPPGTGQAHISAPRFAPGAGSAWGDARDGPAWRSRWGRRRQRRGSRRAGRAAGGTQNDDGLLSSGDARERRGIDGACRVAGPLAAVGRRLAATKCGAQLGLGGGGWRSSVPLNTERMWRVSLNDLKVLTFPTMLRARLLPARAAHARLRFRSQDRLQLPKSASGNFCIAAAGSASTSPAEAHPARAAALPLRGAPRLAQLSPPLHVSGSTICKRRLS